MSYNERTDPDSPFFRSPEREAQKRDRRDANHEFRIYFSDLKRDAEREGYEVDKQTEWRLFIDTKIENGELGEDAETWNTR